MHCLRVGVVLLVALTGCAQEEFSSKDRITSRADAVIAQPVVGGRDLILSAGLVRVGQHDA